MKNNTGQNIEPKITVVVRGLGTREKTVDLDSHLFDVGSSTPISLDVSDLPLQTNRGACTATVEMEWVRTTPAGLETVSESSQPVFVRHSANYKMAFIYSESGFINRTNGCLNGPPQLCLAPRPGEKVPASIPPELESVESRLALLETQSIGREMDVNGAMKEVTISSSLSGPQNGLIAQWMGQDSSSNAAEGGAK